MERPTGTEGIEDTILTAVKQVVRLEELIADPNFSASRAAERPLLKAELREARDRVAQFLRTGGQNSMRSHIRRHRLPRGRLPGKIFLRRN